MKLCIVLILRVQEPIIIKYEFCKVVVTCEVYINR